jgi:hypothetical protein
LAAGEEPRGDRLAGLARRQEFLRTPEAPFAISTGVLMIVEEDTRVECRPELRQPRASSRAELYLAQRFPHFGRSRQDML